MRQRPLLLPHSTQHNGPTQHLKASKPNNTHTHTYRSGGDDGGGGGGLGAAQTLVLQTGVFSKETLQQLVVSTALLADARPRGVQHLREGGRGKGKPVRESSQAASRRYTQLRPSRLCAVNVTALRCGAVFTC